MFETIINKHRSIIVLAGTLPDKKILNMLNTSLPIIAADGAARDLHVYGLKPTYIVGDGDSYMGTLNDPATMHVKISDQDSTDFEKCIQFAGEHDLFPALVLGVNGGEIDHIVGNMQAMVKHAKNNNLYFLDTYTKKQKIGVKIGIPLTDLDHTLTLKQYKGSLFSLLFFGKTVVHSSGLAWEMNNHVFTINDNLGVRNVSSQDTIEIEIKEGRALMVIDISDYWKEEDHA